MMIVSSSSFISLRCTELLASSSILMLSATTTANNKKLCGNVGTLLVLHTVGWLVETIPVSLFVASTNNVDTFPAK